MYKSLNDILIESTDNEVLGNVLAFIISFIIILGIAFVIYLTIRYTAASVSRKAKRKTVRQAASSIINRRIPRKTGLFIIFLLIGNYYSRNLPEMTGFFSKISIIGMLLCIIVLANSLLDVVNDVYSLHSISRKRPIKGPLQIVKIIIALIFSIIVISLLINQNPIVLLSGVGAFTAILSIVFKDALLGLVAGVQISSENLIQIGDWISIPSIGVEGSVTDIALISVKITAFDNTTYMVPAYTFLSVPFKNWHSTLADGRRMIHLYINVDASTVKRNNDDDTNETNLTAYRRAVIDQIRSDKHALSDKTIQCKTAGSAGATGIPVEVFFFCDITDYDTYCEYMTGKYELFIAELSEYGLKPYQATKSVN